MACIKNAVYVDLRFGALLSVLLGIATRKLYIRKQFENKCIITLANSTYFVRNHKHLQYIYKLLYIDTLILHLLYIWMHFWNKAILQISENEFLVGKGPIRLKNGLIMRAPLQEQGKWNGVFSYKLKILQNFEIIKNILLLLL